MLNKVSLLHNLSTSIGTLRFKLELITAIMIFFPLFTVFSLFLRMCGNAENSDFMLRFAFVS